MADVSLYIIYIYDIYIYIYVYIYICISCIMIKVSCAVVTARHNPRNYDGYVLLPSLALEINMTDVSFCFHNMYTYQVL